MTDKEIVQALRCMATRDERRDCEIAKRSQLGCAECISSYIRGAAAAIERLTREMKEAAKLLEFEHAAFLRDQIDRLRRGENPTVDSAAETERKQNHAQTQRKGRKYLGKR